MTAIVQTSRPSPKEMAARITPDFYREAYKRGRSLTAHLELLDPSNRYNDGLDAFDRILMANGIMVRSIPELGLYADTFDRIVDDADLRNLAPELIGRMWRHATCGRPPMNRAAYSSTDDLLNSANNQLAYAADARVTPRRTPPIRLADIVAMTTPITGGTYDAYYLTDNQAQQRMVRVSELSQIPTAKLTGSDHTIKLYKYGRGIVASYEVLRRTRIDKIALWIARLAVQNEMDKVSAATSVLVNGDGNSGTSATNWRAKTDLDSTATGYTLTLKAWLAFKLKFQPSYRLTHILGSEGDALKLLTVPIGTSSTAMPMVMLPLGAMGSLSEMGSNVAGDVQYGVTADVPSNKLVGFDATAALERVIEIGANIEEVERWVSNQSQALYMTETEAFAVIDPYATKTLELES